MHWTYTHLVDGHVEVLKTDEIDVFLAQIQMLPRRGGVGCVDIDGWRVENAHSESHVFSGRIITVGPLANEDFAFHV